MRYKSCMSEVTLQLDEAALTLTVGTEQHRLPIGLAGLSQAFGRRMPDALALENAIADVEDAVMPAARHLPAGTRTLATSSPWLLQLMRSATGDPQARSASREAIETLFSALARQAQQPGYRDAQMPQAPEAAAALLVLRECLHHWGVTELRAL